MPCARHVRRSVEHRAVILLQIRFSRQRWLTTSFAVQERNEQWTANDVVAAWRENRILEKYYGPVLDTPSYVSRTGHRWSPGQRADAEARFRRPKAPA